MKPYLIPILAVSLALFIVACTSPSNPGNQVNVVPNTQPSAPAQVSFTIGNSGCDDTNLYAQVTADKDYAGKVQLKVLQSGAPLNSVENDFTLAAGQAQLLQFAHGQQTTQKIDYQLCINGNCQTSSCSHDTCIKYSNQESLCSYRIDCTYMNNICQPFKCDDYKDNSSCSGYSRCEWFLNEVNKGEPYCRLKPCYELDSADTCVTGYNCKWTGSQCITFSCATTYTSPDLCGQDSRCTWAESQYGSGHCDARTDI